MPPQIEELYRNQNQEAQVKKRKRLVDLNENPIEDTELMTPEYQLPEPLPERPALCFDYGAVSSEGGLALVQIYSFLNCYGTPLKLHPFLFCDFLEALACDRMDLNCELLPEVFSCLLKFACVEYQSKFEGPGQTNVHYYPVPMRDDDGVYSKDIGAKSEMLDMLNEKYEQFDVYERAAADQWYKWRPDQFVIKKKKKIFGYKERLKAWPVALFGFVKDWFHQNESIDMKLELLNKLLFPKTQPEDSMQVDISGVTEESKNSRSGSVSEEEEEVELPKRSERTRGNKNETQIVPLTKTKKETPAAAPKTQCQFEPLCKSMENAFWLLTADEKVALLLFLVNECAMGSDVLRSFRDESLEKTTELKKEQREIARKRKIMYFIIN
jgi:hypothetical protein